MPLMPARMVNEFVYCPCLATSCGRRLESAEIGDTVEGHRVHVRGDRTGAPLPPPECWRSSRRKSPPRADPTPLSGSA